MTEVTPSLPIPISNIGGKYLLFDIDAISWLRRCHNICGVYVGTLPQNPQQNVFMGLPMQIMVEEAQLLLDLGIAYVLNDAKAHDVAMAKQNSDNRQRYVSELDDQISEISAAIMKAKEVDKKKALKRNKEKADKVARDLNSEATLETTSAAEPAEADDSIFSPTTSVSEHSASTIAPRSLAITPATSSLLLGSKSQNFNSVSHLPNLSSSSYAMYKHLHQSCTFYHTPGLRFGSQFSVYPGDPLRFHSHFLAVGLDWEEEIDLMDIVSGGRLGTGVKKGFLLGGREPTSGRCTALDHESSDAGKMRCFSLEWAVM